MASGAMRLRAGDALLVVDLQRDFCPGGALPVPDGDKIVPLANELIEEAVAADACVVAVRDWHPPGHASFHEKGGPWPPHCVQNSAGARFHDDLRLPENAILVSKGMALEQDQYSAFAVEGFADRLRSVGVRRVLIVGLTQEYCVRESALDAVAAGFETHVRLSGTRPITLEKGREAVEDLRHAGVIVEDGEDKS
ncbi:isochorismatase family protein [Methylocystis sp. 9N]|uniref:nicotinamidase n=1 Tax=Methylocystis borbori TaxID=3118750 RepID=A0ABU7XE15_9HYPH